MTFAIAPLTTFPKAASAAFPMLIEWRDEGVALGNSGPRVIDFVGNPTMLRVTRGVGEFSHVITVNKLLTSVLQCLNGPQWSLRSAPSSENWHNVAFGNDVFAVIGTDFSGALPCAAYSTDGGVSWTVSPTTFPSLGGTGGDVGVRERMLAFGAGQFICIGNKKEIFSADGINWDVGPALTMAGTPKHMFFGGSVFLVVCSATDKLYTSPGDGNYTERTLPAGDAWSAGAFGNGRYIVVASQATAKSDNGGVTWTSGGNLPADVGSCPTMAYGNGVWVVVPNGNVTTLYYSIDDGATWNLTNTLNASAQAYSRVRYVGGIFYVCPNLPGDNAYKSVDGITWTLANGFTSMAGYFSLDWDGGVMAGGFVYAAAGVFDGTSNKLNSGVCSA